tara:strand:+ start:218 stop:514 length:297 start_codon:yes stop_codon:yes gene_type:complete
MIFLKKISVIIFSIGILYIPNYALTNEKEDNISIGMLYGTILTICGLYENNIVTEYQVREIIEGSFELLESWNLSHREQEFYKMLDMKELRSCNKFFP